MRTILIFGVLLIQGCVSLDNIREYDGSDKASVTLTGVWTAVGLYQDSGNCYTRKIMPKGKEIQKSGNEFIPESTTLYYKPNSIVMYSLDRMYMTNYSSSNVTTATCSYVLAFKPSAGESYTIGFDMGHEDCVLEVKDSTGLTPSEMYISNNIYDVARNFDVRMCHDYLNGGLAP